jgi:hypothetical protein
MLKADAADFVVATFGANVQRELRVVHDHSLVAAAEHAASIELIDLKVVRGIGKHVPVVALAIERRVPVLANQSGRPHPPPGFAGRRRIESAEFIGADGRADRTLRNLLRWMPRRVIAGQRQLQRAERR